MTAKPTFTSFLIFAARRDAPWRLALLPVWALAMIGYRIGFYGRETLKPLGISLFVGRRLGAERGARLARAFTDRLEADGGFLPGALARIAADRADGARLVLATAAPEFYAHEIARRLGFDACLATRHRRTADGGHEARFSGPNNYGAHKWARVETWLAEQRLPRESVEIRAYSDHASDAPLLHAADKAVFVTTAGKSLVAGCAVEDWR